MVTQQKEIYRGKAKTLFETDNKDVLWCEYRNDISAFNAEKLANLERKGQVNNYFNAFIMSFLEKKGVKTHFIERVAANASLVKRLTMLPIECVVRNRAAGNLCKRLGIEKNKQLLPPVFEFFYKNDKLGDPLVNESHMTTFQWATPLQIQKMKEITLQVNEILSEFFDKSGLILVDYKLEFGLYEGNLLLGDEFTPDGCRIWDKETLEIFDKDRFRQDLGHVVEYYETVAQRLGIPLG